MCGALPALAFGGGGTQASPYLIGTWDDLVALSDSSNSATAADSTGAVMADKYFQLTADLKATGTFTPVASRSSGHRFAGHLDGAGHTITGLTESGQAYSGLIGYLDSLGTVCNLTLDSVNITYTGYSESLGGVVGYCSGKVTNCHVQGVLKGNNALAGGIAGAAWESTALIENCTFDGSVTYNGTRSSGQAFGGIVGRVYRGTIRNCHASGTVALGPTSQTSAYVGGIAGDVTSGATVVQCYYTGTVQRSTNARTRGQYIGGVAGRVYLSTISRSFAIASISGNYSSIGLIAGLNAGGTVTDCYARGYVNDATYISGQPRRIGGLVGLLQTVTTTAGTTQPKLANSWVAAQLNVATSYIDPVNTTQEIYGGAPETAEVSNIYFDQDFFSLGSINHGVSTSVLTSASGPAGLDASVWNFTQGYYPRLKGIDDNAAAHLSASVFATGEGDYLGRLTRDAELHLLGDTKAYIVVDNSYVTQGKAGSIAGGTYKIGKAFASDVIAMRNDSLNAGYTLNVSVAPVFLAGAGTESNPYLIASVADLDSLSAVVNKYGQYYARTYFSQTADLDMSADSAFAPLSTFQGHYDGGGHTLNHMKIGGTAANAAFIGKLDKSGSLSRLAIDATSAIAGSSNVAAFVATNNGSVAGVVNHASVTATGAIAGGIVGTNNGTIAGALNTGDVAASGQAGGIVGHMADGTLTEGMNVGRVTATSDYAGGVVGSALNSTLSNVANAGQVNSAATSVGGIVGGYQAASSSTMTTANAIASAIDYGVETAGDITALGTIAGTAQGGEVISNTYYDSQMSLSGAVKNDPHAGVTGYPTASLTAGVAPAGIDTVWQFSAGNYPVLKRFASEPAVKAAASAYLVMGEGQRLGKLRSDATMHAHDALSWTLAGNNFTIDGDTLRFPHLTSTTARDTLTVAGSGFIKAMPLTAVGDMPLAGDGTEASPYLIGTPAEWNTLAQYIDDTQDDLAGEYVKLTANIAFADSSFKTLGDLAAIGFGAHLDGNNKTVSGIHITGSAANVAPIGRLRSTGSIKNLITAGTVNSSANNTAGIVAMAEGPVENGTSRVAVTSTSDYVGGIAAQSDANASFTACVNEGAIEATGRYVGGIVGNAKSHTTFTDCANHGVIVAGTSYTATRSGSVETGGIVGHVNNCGGTFVRCSNDADVTAFHGLDVGGILGQSGTGPTPLRFIDCSNSGNITAASVAAGIFAATDYASNITYADGSLYKSPILADGCTNTGAITANVDSASFIGVGACSGVFGYATPGSVIRNCANEGKVNSLSTNSRKLRYNVHVGGIVGNMFSSSHAHEILITGCRNTGAVSGYQETGGVTGNINAYSIVDSCRNEGTVNATAYAGGITGRGYDHATLRNSYNIADVTTTANYAGGAVGYSVGGMKITNCFNAGNITAGTNCAGGVAGYSSAYISNSSNVGTITAAQGVGGIAGYAYVSYNQSRVLAGATTAYNCYNAGQLTSTSGNGISSLIGDFSRADLDINQVLGSYYVTDYGTHDADSVGTPVTVAELAANTTMAPHAVVPHDLTYYQEDSLSAGWNYGDAYTLPIVKTLEDDDAAKLYATVIVLAEGDSLQSVTHDFHVGAPEGLTWTSSDPAISISGNNATVSNDGSGKTITLTATCGNYSKTWTLTLGNLPTGVSAPNSDDTRLLNENEPMYNVAGQRVGSSYQGLILQKGKVVIRR